MRALKRVKINDILFFDIETSSVVKELELDTPLFNSWEYKKRRNDETDQELIDMYRNEAALYSEFGRIVCISVGMLGAEGFKTTTFNNFDEGVMIKEFYAMLDKLKAGAIICGHAIKQFDIPYVAHRGMVHNLVPHDLMDVSGLKPWEVDWIIDTKEMWQGTSYNRASLLGIVTILNLPSPKGGITGKDVPAYFWADPEGHIQEISEYCERDVVATYDVVNYWKNLGQEQPVQKSLIEELFDGRSYGEEEEKMLKDHLRAMTKEDREKAYKILGAMCSSAKGKKTAIQKKDITAMKKELK